MRFENVVPDQYTMHEILQKLYSRDLEIQVHVYEKGSTQTIRILEVDLQGIDGKPDCCINSFSQNWFIRTQKGMRGEKYKTLSGLVGAIANEVKKAGYKIYIIGIYKFGTKELVAGFTE